MFCWLAISAQHSGCVHMEENEIVKKREQKIYQKFVQQISNIKEIEM